MIKKILSLYILVFSGIYGMELAYLHYIPYEHSCLSVPECYEMVSSLPYGCIPHTPLIEEDSRLANCKIPFKCDGCHELIEYLWEERGYKSATEEHISISSYSTFKLTSLSMMILLLVAMAD